MKRIVYKLAWIVFVLGCAAASAHATEERVRPGDEGWNTVSTMSSTHDTAVFSDETDVPDFWIEGSSAGTMTIRPITEGGSARIFLDQKDRLMCSENDEEPFPCTIEKIRTFFKTYIKNERNIA